MGDFFKSPHERASSNLYEMAMRGDVIGSNLLRQSSASARNAVGITTANRASGVAGDIMSQFASMGVTPGSANVTAVTDKALTPLYAGEQSAHAQISGQEIQGLLQLLMGQLSTGLAGLSTTSTFGDIMAGLTTAANVGAGVATGGGALGWWGKTPPKTA